MPSIRAAVIVLFVSGILGCAVNDKTYWTITDSTIYWDRSGYSIRPPSGSYWVKQPTDDNYPNLIVFYKGEALVMRGAYDKWLYMKGSAALATSTVLDEPVLDRRDSNLVASALRKHLERYQIYSPTKINEASFDSSLGQDCLKYSGASKVERYKVEQGDYHAEEIKGYFCLHPEIGNFGVIMESRNFATVGTRVSNKDSQMDHFFESLRFNHLSSAVSRTYRVTSHQVGKTPC